MIKHHEVTRAREVLALAQKVRAQMLADDICQSDLAMLIDEERWMAAVIMREGPDPHHRITDTYEIAERTRLEAQARLQANRVSEARSFPGKSQSFRRTSAAPPPPRAPVVDIPKPPHPSLGLGRVSISEMIEAELVTTSDVDEGDILSAEEDAFSDEP